MTFGEFGVTSICPTVPTCRPGSRRHRVAHRDRQVRRREHRVLPLGDRRRAGVVGEAGDHRLVAIDRDDAFDDADRDAGALERAALLDVQLEIAVVRALRPARLEDAIGIAADLAGSRRRASARSRPRPCRRSRSGRRRCGCRRGRGRTRSLLRAPRRPSRADGACATPAASSASSTAERAERPEIAVEVAAVRHRVDVRAEQDRRQRRPLPRAAREDVAGRIDARLQARRPCISSMTKRRPAMSASE